MPNSIDLLFERLKQFDEVTLLELLDITSEDILERFKDKVVKRKEMLYGEVELFSEEEIDDDHDSEYDGYQIETLDDDYEGGYEDEDDSV